MQDALDEATDLWGVKVTILDLVNKSKSLLLHSSIEFENTVHFMIKSINSKGFLSVFLSLKLNVESRDKVNGCNFLCFTFYLWILITIYQSDKM